MNEDRGFTDGMQRKIFRLIFTVVAMLVLSFAVLYLWNAILPQTINAGVISYWQALGLLVLCRLLFGNFHFGLPWGRANQIRGDKPGAEFLNLNDRDKTTFKEEWRKRCEKLGRRDSK